MKTLTVARVKNGKGLWVFVVVGVVAFLVPVWPLVGLGDFPESLFFSLGLFLQVDEFLFVDTDEYKTLLAILIVIFIGTLIFIIGAGYKLLKK